MESGEPGRDILRAAGHYSMFKPGDKVLVAVSGGPDSVAMLHALHCRSDEFDITLHIAHLNHGIRGEESNIDQDFVSNLGHEFGLQVTTRKVDLPSLRKKMRVGEEEAARIVRYQFLRETAKEVGANKIAVGHTADDRAESVLFNVIRGTGVDGLGSIRPVRGNIVRPLIDTTRKEIESYIEENHLPYRIDESNMDVTYARNRIRHELLPLLERDYNPQIRRALVSLADIAAAESDFAADRTAPALGSIAYRGVLDAGLFGELPLAPRRRIIRAEIERLKGDLRDVEIEQVDRVINALEAGGDFVITLPSGEIFAERSGNAFEIRGRETVEPPKEFDYVLQIPGVTVISETGIEILAEVVETPVATALAPNETLIDRSSIVGLLRIRSVHPGDRIMPFGMKGSKKLQDVFVDKKIPRGERARAAVVVDDEKVIWVPGVVASEATRVTALTRSAVRLVAAEIAE